MTKASPPVGALDHPLVRSYLAELTTALAGAPPTEREDVLQMVREHIALAVEDGSNASDQDVEAVLRSLGPPAVVAEGMDLAPADDRPPVHTLPRWVGTTALAVGALSLLLVLLVPLVAAPLAALALVGGLLGMRADHGPGRWRFQLAAALGGLTALVLAVLAVTLLGVSQEAVPSDPQPATQPAS